MNLKAKLLISQARRLALKVEKITDKGYAIEAKLSKMVGHGITQDEYDHIAV